MEKVQISSSQIFFLVLAFTLGSSLIIPPASSIGNAQWLAIVIGLGEGLLFAWVYTTLIARFKSKTLIDVLEIVFGPTIGRLLGFVWILFPLHLGALVIGNYSDLFTGVVMVETPSMVFGLLLVGTCAYAVWHGLETVARCAQILVIPGLGMVFLSAVLSVPKMDWQQLYPLLDASWSEILWAAHGAATFPFAETVVFAMVIPYMSKRHRAASLISKALISAACIFLIAALRNILVLGPIMEIEMYPSYTAGRQIDIGEFFTRLEILIVIEFVLMGFVKLSVLLYTFVAGTAHALHLRDKKPLVWPAATVMLCVSVINSESVIHSLTFARDVYPLYALPFQLVIPLVTLAVAHIRKMPGS